MRLDADRKQFAAAQLEAARRAIGEPWLATLYAAIAAVESGWGAHAIRRGGMLNEIGYKAVAGRPSVTVETREATGPGGRLEPVRTGFRLFADRAAQARAMHYLMRRSSNFEAARLLYTLAFYAAYAPGRPEGLRAVIEVFNELAASGLPPTGNTRPFQTPTSETDPNHAAARIAVRTFAELTSQPGVTESPAGR